jgi:HEAT repeat protein
LATAVLQALIKIGAPAVPELVKATHSKNAVVRRYAAYALGKIGGQDAFAALEKAAHDPDKEVRRQTAAAFALINDPRSMTTLLDLLRDRSSSVRAEAAGALGAVGDKRVVAPLIEYGLCDLSPETSAAATAALAAIGDPAVEPLIETFNARPSYARQRILIALAKIGAQGGKGRDRAVQTAVWVMPHKNESGDVRAAAAYALGDMDAQEGVPALKQALKDATQDSKSEDARKVAAACRMALDKIYQRHQMPHDY